VSEKKIALQLISEKDCLHCKEAKEFIQGFAAKHNLELYEMDAQEYMKKERKDMAIVPTLCVINSETGEELSCWTDVDNIKKNLPLFWATRR